jgi:hypothetical protein
MGEEQVRKTGTENEKQVRKMKTRCYYTDYVNHAIRFFLSTPEKLSMEGKRKADIDNWLAVQFVFNKLPERTKEVITKVYSLNYRVQEGVRLYCENTGENSTTVWTMVTKTAAAVAKARGLV